MLLDFSLLGYDIGLAEAFTALAAILTYIFGYITLKSKELGEQVVTIVKTVGKSLDEDSEDGKNLSEEEKKKIAEEFIVLAKIIWTTYGRTWVGRTIFKFGLISESEAEKLEA